MSTDDMTTMKTPKPTLTIRDVAAQTRLSIRTVIRIFENEPGVFVLERPEVPGKRRYRSFRIPREVYERVLKRIREGAS